MPNSNLIVSHYTHGSLLDAIRRGLQKLGKTPANLSVEDLGPVDEFHIGGRAATESFLDQLHIDAGHSVLDVGCGIGGTSRFAAQRYGCQVSGIDLTREYVETGAVLCSWLGLGSRIHLEQGDATALPYPDGTFDRAFMLHVGMNIVDKRALAVGLYRVLRAGGLLGIYDVMRTGDGDLVFPLPWASGPEGSAVATPDAYKSALKTAGFRIVSARNRRDDALDFFAQMQARAAGGVPPLGVHILMGNNAAEKVKNAVRNISRNLIAPIEIIAEKIR